MIHCEAMVSPTCRKRKGVIPEWDEEVYITYEDDGSQTQNCVHCERFVRHEEVQAECSLS